MRGAYRVLAFILAAEVVIQAMAIAFALAGLGYWVAEEGGVLNKQVIDSESADFTGVIGFPVHGINGMMVIPVLTLLLLIFSFFTKVPGATRFALIILGLVVVQVVLGITSHSLPAAILLHALNAFAIFSMAAMAGVRARASAVADTRVGATV